MFCFLARGQIQFIKRGYVVYTQRFDLMRASNALAGTKSFGYTGVSRTLSRTGSRKASNAGLLYENLPSKKEWEGEIEASIKVNRYVDI